MKKDKLGVVLKEGDRVVYISQYWRELELGKIVRFTPKMVFIERDGGGELKQFPEQVLSIKSK